MTTRAALFALLALWGVGTTGALPVRADDLAAGDAGGAESRDVAETTLTGRVWVQAAEGELPGVMRIFLPDGTLVQDSCWEAYRLSEWQMVSQGRIRLTENGALVEAAIEMPSPTELVLRFDLDGASIEEHYTSTTIPHVWTDLPKA